MYSIIQYSNPPDPADPFSKLVPSIDRIQNIILSYVTSEFFPWVCLIFLLNKKNLKRPVILILIIHWVLRSTGDALREFCELLPIPNNIENPTLWPNTNTRWIVGNAVAHLFWLGGEIFGDWYLYLRTKAVTSNEKKSNTVFYCCFLYNIIKIIGIASYFIYIPFDFRVRDEFGKPRNGLQLFDITWWTIVIVYHIIGFMYDFSVMYALKTELFDKLTEYKNISKNTFMDKFKQISELRIFITMGATLLFLPFIIFIVIILIIQYYRNVTTFIDPDPIRQVPLSLYYNLIYIDQILLRCFAERQQKQQEISFITFNNTKTSNNSNSIANGLTKNVKFNYSKLEYSEYNGNDNTISTYNMDLSKSEYSLLSHKEISLYDSSITDRNSIDNGNPIYQRLNYSNDYSNDIGYKYNNNITTVNMNNNLDYKKYFKF